MENLNDLLNNFIRPILQVHGGDLEIIDYVDGNIRLRLKGECCTCPIAHDTTEDFIKKTIYGNLKEAKTIIIESGLSDELVDIAKMYLKGDEQNELA